MERPPSWEVGRSVDLPTIKAVPSRALTSAHRETDDPEKEEDDRHDPKKVDRKAETCK